MKKNILILVFLLLSANVIANDISAYEVMFDELKTKRKGLSEKEIFSLKDPFNLIVDKKDSKKIEKVISKYKLTAILSNKVKINGNWYFLNDQMENYKIIKIKKSSVTLKDKDEILELKLHEGNKDVKITYR